MWYAYGFCYCYFNKYCIGLIKNIILGLVGGFVGYLGTIAISCIYS